jgi:hypothetical protein
MGGQALDLKPGALTDAQARNLVIKSLRQARAKYRTADTTGERLEREFDRLIKRKTRINARSLVTLGEHYKAYLDMVTALQYTLATAYEAASLF